MKASITPLVLFLKSLCLESSSVTGPGDIATIGCGEGTYLDRSTNMCVRNDSAEIHSMLFGFSSYSLYSSPVTLLASFTFVLLMYIVLKISQEEYVLEYELDAPVDAVYEVLSNVERIAEVHPKLKGVSKVLKEKRGPYGAVLEWELETSAMWAPPWPLGFLKHLKTHEHVSTVAMLTPGEYAHIQNTGLKNYRGKIVPFYYLHWWELTALPGGRTKMMEYELLKGSKIKFLLGATPATIQAHKVIQANLEEWARALDQGGSRARCYKENKESKELSPLPKGSTTP
eukprot:gnl/MRDRNA2_/MRDRNA2_131326_c0_seq1.p1 gnl/MRDRNA2_/MRDRNA2_131326_c0~~gnl/MRDRNA2_/MRDRNA2_131326_c0_seq1.p1  ORF type:complete len:286 (+),score=41.58 gnl/MRDRNA2_/MRDRNA2_131326_c0_seq1:83-940(+)